MCNIHPDILDKISQIKALDSNFSWHTDGNRYSYDGSIWVRFWCTSKHNGCQIGKINFVVRNDIVTLYSCGSYKKYDYPYDIDDHIWLKINAWMSGTQITDDQIAACVEQAKQRIEQDYQRKVQWRLDNPAKKKLVRWRHRDGTVTEKWRARRACTAAGRSTRFSHFGATSPEFATPYR